jgi:hypothetical protein
MVPPRRNARGKKLSCLYTRLRREYDHRMRRRISRLKKQLDVVKLVSKDATAGEALSSLSSMSPLSSWSSLSSCSSDLGLSIGGLGSDGEFTESSSDDFLADISRLAA